MTDIAALSVDSTPAATPVFDRAEIEALIERKAQEISDKRVSGLMSTYDKKIAESQKELAKLRRQVLPDEPTDTSDSEAQNAALLRENAILKAAARFPKAAPVYQ